MLPKPCESNHDCLAEDEITEGICSCLGPAGSFCELHESDNLNLNFLQASFESRVEDAEILFKRISNFPVYELDFKWASEFEHSEELDGIFHDFSGILGVLLSILLVS
jgi:hypothetical protein